MTHPVGRLLHIGFEGLEPPAYVLEWLQTGQVGGIVLFERNVANPAQLQQLVAACRAAARYPLLVSIDQEGGRVARLRAGFSESPGAMALGAARSESLAERVAGVMGTELRALDINWVLAPVVDLALHPENPVIGTRSLGQDPEQVTRLAQAQIRGFQQAGVAATLKHFPGHGSTVVDSHVALPVVDVPLAEIWERDLRPFRALAPITDAIMLSHVQYTDLDAEYPTSLSPAAGRMLRDRIGFAGVICTDCMEMPAVIDHYGAGEAAVLAAQAGNDILFFSHTPAYQQAAFDALVAAAEAGQIPDLEDKLARIETLVVRYPVGPQPPMEVIRQPQHLATLQQAARAAVTLVKTDRAVFPLDLTRKITLVEFASLRDTPAIESGGTSSLGTFLRQEAPSVNIISLPVETWDAERLGVIREQAHKADVLVLATRNAHLWDTQRQLARELMWIARKVVLVCLANPYDAAALPGANAVLCTCGDSTPSLEAAVAALLGQFTPTGSLPV
jgi:beta-N-acetylhexosaminidase